MAAAAVEKRDDGLIQDQMHARADEWMLDADVQSDDDADAPSSNIRLSDPPSNADLSFKVYTLAELERRSDAPIAMRLSRVAFESLPKRRHEKWRAMGSSFRGLVAATVRWSRTKNELGRRASPKTLWSELDAFGNVAQVAVDSVDWKKHGVTLGIVVGAMFTLLFGVLLCAEMTDDLKPGGGVAHLASPATLEVLPSPRALPSVPVAASTAEDTVDDPEPPPAPPKPAPHRVKPRSKLTFRNADAIFNP